MENNWRQNVAGALHGWGQEADEAIRYYGGPHVYGALQKLGSLAEMFSPGADIVDAQQNYRQAYDSASQGDVPGALGSAGWGALSNMGLSEVSRPVGAMVLGASAKTADLEKLLKAQDMAAEGWDRVPILDETGWYQGPDQHWRFEVSDKDFRLSGSAHDALQELDIDQDDIARGTVGEFVNAPYLAEAYPDLNDVELRISDLYEQHGVHSRPYHGKPERLTAASRSGIHDLEDVLLHELQHAAQYREGFARGGNMSAAEEMMSIDADILRRAAASVSDLLAKGQDEDAAAAIMRRLEKYPHLMDKFDSVWRLAITHRPREMFRLESDLAPYGIYNRFYGEAEARNTPRRRMFDQQELIGIPPWVTLDRPEGDLILRGSSGGPLSPMDDPLVRALLTGQDLKTPFGIPRP